MALTSASMATASGSTFSVTSPTTFRLLVIVPAPQNRPTKGPSKRETQAIALAKPDCAYFQGAAGGLRTIGSDPPRARRRVWNFVRGRADWPNPRAGDRKLFPLETPENRLKTGQIRPGPPKNGRSAYQTAEIIPYGTERRLPDDAKRTFVEVVSTHTATHFKPSDLTVLCRYCELVVLAERAAFELSRNGVVLPDGTLSKWFGVHASTTKQIGVLAARLKIGPSTREKRQSKKTPAPVSVYDQIRNRKDWP